MHIYAFLTWLKIELYDDSCKSFLGISVSCGMHEAPRCSDCPGENGGPNMCNGQCKWDHSLEECVDQGKLFQHE